MKENVQRAVFKQSVKKSLAQFKTRADNLNADVYRLNSTWDGSLSVKKTALMFQLLQNNLEISLFKKDAKNVLLGKSHLCFNQELQKHTLFPLTVLDWLCMDSRFRFFSPHWFPGSLMARFVASSDIFLLEFAVFIENPYLLPVY